jgi:hypothetical protein
VRAGRLRALAAFGLAIFAASCPAALANDVPQKLPFAQDWNNTGLITQNNDMTAVPGIELFGGTSDAADLAQDPQTVTADLGLGNVDVSANRVNPNTEISTGGGEFHLADPTVALQSGANDTAPNLVLVLDTTNSWGNVVSYELRDIEDDIKSNSIQPFALQYRVGATGDYTNIPEGFRKDVTNDFDSPVTPVSVALPADANNKPLVFVRMITTNAIGQQDEWVGIDDVAVAGTMTDTNGDAAPDAPLNTDADPALPDSADACPDLASDLPDGCPPLTVDVAAKDRQDADGLKLKASCSRACELTVRASGRTDGKGFASRRARRALAGGDRQTLRIRFSENVLDRLTGESPKARIDVTADPVAGDQDPTRERERVRLSG